MEKSNIGKVKINYIDGKKDAVMTPFEADLLKVVRDLNPYEYRRVCDEKADAHSERTVDYLYNLSDVRGNIVRWLPIETGDSVLELDAEYGAISDVFVKKSGNVYVTVGRPENAEIIAERFSDCNGLTIYVGKNEAVSTVIKEDVGLFDWILVKNPDDLKMASSLVKKEGHILFATDNRMGMRNLAGLKGRKDKELFAGVEGDKSLGLTLSGLKLALKSAGIKNVNIYYPYPDFTYMKTLFSEDRLPKVGELIDNGINLIDDRLDVFSEKAAFDAAIQDGSFPVYANSYFAICGPKLETVYARFSNDRAPEYCIYTSIEKAGKDYLVRKYPISDAANEHIRKLKNHYEMLSKKYEGSKLSINKCSVIDIGNALYADFEYVEGRELSEMLDACLNNDDIEGFYKLFDRYVTLTGFNDSFSYADVDLVFSNILVDGDNWTLVDYEWCKDASMPVKETAYRAIYCYILEDKAREKINLDLIREKLVLSKEASEDIEDDEMTFQKSVTGKFLSLAEISWRLDYKSVSAKKATVLFDRNTSIYKFRVYPGGQKGSFSEDTAYDLEDTYKSDTYAEALIPVSQNDTVMRVDPLDSSCLVVIREAKLGELDFPYENKKYLVANGKRIGDNTFAFSTNDPNLYFDLDGFIHEEDTFLFLRMDVIPMAADTMANIENHIKRIF